MFNFPTIKPIVWKMLERLRIDQCVNVHNLKMSNKSGNDMDVQSIPFSIDNINLLVQNANGYGVIN